MNESNIIQDSSKKDTGNAKHDNEVSEVQHVVETLQNMKEELEEKRNQESHNLKVCKIIGSVTGGAFILSNIVVAFLVPQVLGLSLLASAALFASLSINEFIEARRSKNNIKKLTNKINFFNLELRDANDRLCELMIKNDKVEESKENKCTRYKIQRIYKKEELYEKYRKNEKRILGLYRKQAIDKYLSKKGYSEFEISLFHEIIQEDMYLKTKDANEQIANKHYVLSQKSNSSENIGLYYK